MAEMLYVVTQLEAVPQRMEAALATARRLAREMSSCPGAHRVVLLQRIHTPTNVEIVSRWESDDDYQSALRSPLLQATRSEIDLLLAAPIDDRLHHAMPTGS